MCAQHCCGDGSRLRVTSTCASSESEFRFQSQIEFAATASPSFESTRQNLFHGQFYFPRPPELLKKNVPHRTLRDVCSHNPGGNSGCGTGFPRDGKMLSRRIGTPDGTGRGEIGIPVTRWNGKRHSGQTE